MTNAKPTPSLSLGFSSTGLESKAVQLHHPEVNTPQTLKTPFTSIPGTCLLSGLHSAQLTDFRRLLWTPSFEVEGRQRNANTLSSELNYSAFTGSTAPSNKTRRLLYLRMTASAWKCPPPTQQRSLKVPTQENSCSMPREKQVERLVLHIDLEVHRKVQHARGRYFLRKASTSTQPKVVVGAQRRKS